MTDASWREFHTPWPRPGKRRRAQSAASTGDASRASSSAPDATSLKEKRVRLEILEEKIWKVEIGRSSLVACQRCSARVHLSRHRWSPVINRICIWRLVAVTTPRSVAQEHDFCYV